MSSKKISVTMDYEEYLAERGCIAKAATEAERQRIDEELLDITRCSAPNLYSCTWPKQNIIRHVRMALGLEKNGRTQTTT